MSLAPRALLLILVTGLIAILGTWSASTSATTAWALPAALLLAGLAYEAAQLRRLQLHLSVEAPGYWPLGRARSVRLTFQHGGSRLLPIQVVLSAPEDVAADWRVETLRLPPQSSATAVIEATPGRLGPCTWPAPVTRVAGVLGLAWWSRKVPVQCSFQVVPDLLTRMEEAMGERNTGIQASRTAGHGTELLQLRDYQRGDPMRSIDWKATARRKQLISRDFSQDPHLTVIVAIDIGRAAGLGAGGIDRLGLYVNVAARFAQRAAALGDAVGLVLFAAQPLSVLNPARGEAAVHRIRELLTACRVQPGESNPVLAAARIRALAQPRSLVLFLTDLEETSAGEQLVKAVQLLSPKHLPFIAGFQSEKVEALVRAQVEEPLGAYRALAAIEHERTVQANVRALRALGAPALTARPSDLDAAVLAAYRQLRAQRRI